MSTKRKANVSKKIVLEAFKDAFKKLNPKVMARNPVMFVVEIGFVITLLLSIFPALFGGISERGYNIAVTIILFVTIIFANFAEALAEGRGKAQANSLKKTKQDTKARLILKDGSIKIVDATELRKGDTVLVKANDLIPTDGDVIEGVAAVDESAITGESAAVIKESGGDFSSVTGGTKVISDYIKVKVSTDPGESFLDRMINLVEGAKRQKTPNEIALSTLLVSLTLIFLLVCTTLVPIASYIKVTLPIATLIALLVCLIPTTIGGLLSAIGIAGMDRVTQYNVIAKSGKSVEAAGDINTIILDKTGTITHGNRMAAALLPVSGISQEELNKFAVYSSLHDETPEGRSVIEFAKKSGLSEKGLDKNGTEGIEFTAETRMSGTDFTDGKKVRKGAVDAIIENILYQGEKSQVI